MKVTKNKRTKLGRDLEQAFRDLARYLREETDAEEVGKSVKWTSTVPESHLRQLRKTK